MKYPAKFTPDAGGFVVTFRDVPEAITQGDDFDYALEATQDALACGLSFYTEKGDSVPDPSEPEHGEVMIEIDEWEVGLYGRDDKYVEVADDPFKCLKVD